MGNGASPVAERQFVENTMNFMQSIVEVMMPRFLVCLPSDSGHSIASSRGSIFFSHSNVTDGALPSSDSVASMQTMTKTQVENTAMQAQMQAELLKQLQVLQMGTLLPGNCSRPSLCAKA